MTTVAPSVVGFKGQLITQTQLGKCYNDIHGPCSMLVNEAIQRTIHSDVLLSISNHCYGYNVNMFYIQQILDHVWNKQIPWKQTSHGKQIPTQP